MSHGLTTIPVDWPLVMEEPPSVTHVTAPGTIYSWITQRSGHTGDQLRWDIYSNGSLWNSFGFSLGGNVRHGFWYVAAGLPPGSGYGSWNVKIFVNGTQVAQQDFTYDTNPNQAPTFPRQVVEMSSNATHVSELTATDLDGSIFWYKVQAGPWNGQFKQYGGRGRKYQYTPSPDLAGSDSVKIYAVDDQNLTGPSGYLVFRFHPCGDANGNFSVNISDAVYLIAYVFSGGPAPVPLETGDVDCNGIVNISDLVYLTGYVFNGSPSPCAACK